jgi:GT2 family glycosyltransferase
VIARILPRRTADTHFFFNAQLNAVLCDDGLYRTAGMLVPRRVFVAVAGFDRSFSLRRSGINLGGEDTNFGWKIRRRGLLAVFRPDVAVVHLATPISLRGWLFRPPLQTQTLARLIRTIPELRETVLWHRYFLSEHDFTFLIGLSGVLAALALHIWPLALVPLVFVWSIRNNLVGMIRKGRLDKAGAIALLLLARTAISVSVLAYASARYRRLVL